MKKLLSLVLVLFVLTACNGDIAPSSDTTSEDKAISTTSTVTEDTSIADTSDTTSTESAIKKNATVIIDYADNTLYDEVSFAEDGANYDLIFFTNATVKDFTLLEMDESEVLQIGDALWCIDELTPEKPVIVSTWLNDATISRGISYIDKNGKEHVFSIVLSMKDESVSLVEFKEQSMKDESGPLDEFTEQKTLTIDEAFEAYLKGEMSATWIDFYNEVREVYLRDHFSWGGSYAFYDVTGDGVPELHLRFAGYRILMYQDGKLVTIYVARTNGMNGPINLLENGAMLTEHHDCYKQYTYTTFNADGTTEEIHFESAEYPEHQNVENSYYYEGKEVTKQEFDELTKEIFALRKIEPDWIKWDGGIDAAFEDYLEGMLSSTSTNGEIYVYQRLRGGDGKEGIDDYAFYDVTGDGVPELHLRFTGYTILMYRDAYLFAIYESGTNGQHGPIALLENGAMLEKHTTFETRYTYTTFNDDGISNKTEFGFFENPEDETQNEYWFGEYDKKVTKEEFDELTKDIFAAAEKKAELDWIEWTQQ